MAGTRSPARPSWSTASRAWAIRIQFCRFVPLVAARGAQVIFEVQKPLQALMASLGGAAQAVPKGGPLPAFDFHCPLVSLPLAFGTRLETIPSTAGYLSAPAQHVTAWQSRLEGKPHPRVGLVWSGNPGHERDRERSISLRAFLPLLDNLAAEATLCQPAEGCPARRCRRPQGAR